ncbi:MAG: L,D-transpeptidase family protein [Pseudolabrys sp.]|nr:L,D-transpeptidase family protein [Pseudolabrys sp.]
MRKHRVDRLLASTVLSLIVAVPTVAVATPDRIQSVAPLAPSLNGRMPRPREAAPLPPAPLPSTPLPRAQPVATEPRVINIAPPAEPPAADARAETPRETVAPANSVSLDRPLAASDQQIADRLRSLATGKDLEKRVDRVADRRAIEAFYASRNFAPLWIKDGLVTPRARSIVERLNNASADGLDAPDYPVPDFGALTNADALADADIAFTATVLIYARHLSLGRIAPTRVTAEVDHGNRQFDAADALQRVAEAGNVNATFEGFNPPHAAFRALKQKLAELRREPVQQDTGIPDGPVIKPGARDPRIPALRQRLRVAGKPGDTTYDKALFEAIKRVQANANLRQSGLIGAQTIAAINGPNTAQQIDRIVANLERWRWLPRDLGRVYVMVNVPDYTLRVMRDNNLVWNTKIVVGKPQTPTPLLTAVMDNIIVNPSWYVPQSIIQNELLPLYASDPNIFNRLGYEVKRGPDGHINVVQPPGAANALGRIKFNFQNKYHVYLHDTPEKRLFARDQRAFSHGCMRVEDPTKFGEVMLGLGINGATPDSRQITAMFGQEEKTFRLTNRAMVHLTYQTAYVDDAGKLVLRDDIYGFDARIKAIMSTNERRVADQAPPQDPTRALATLKSNQEILRRVERRETGNPLAFFERLFR